MKKQYDNWLLELTQLPTAAGCEQRVIDWVSAWARRRKCVTLTADRFGNLLLERSGPKSKRPIFFTAHMDHPAFVVTKQIADCHVRADFRGGVFDPYFVGTKVLLHRDGRKPARGVIETLRPASKEADRSVTVSFKRKITAAQGDVMTWDTGPARFFGDRVFRGGRFVAPACDDLAGVAAALAAFDAIAPSRRRFGFDVRVLLTRAEEVGFVGAIAACKAGSIPSGARVIALEMSKSFSHDSPIGGGPIVRIGDRTSSFDPDLTYRICRIAERIERSDPDFAWQRKLMPGGTCEASAYQEYGYTAACVCLALGNYHNMAGDAAGGRIAPETISLADYHDLIRFLVAIGKSLDDRRHAPALRTRLEGIYAGRRHLLS